mgnify:CR=1 FL=1
MKEYTPKQIKKLEANPYTFKVTKNKLYFTIKFKEDFWIRYQAGNAPRKIMQELGYDLSLFTQKQIDNYVQRIKKEALNFVEDYIAHMKGEKPLHKKEFDRRYGFSPLKYFHKELGI